MVYVIRTKCPEQDSNLHASRHTHLKRARLPIPPPGLHHLNISKIHRAANETRTRDPDLGKVVLYQLSYCRISAFDVKRRRLELPRHNCHYPLKVARLPIPPSLQATNSSKNSILCIQNVVPRTGLEPARLAAHAPETCASTNSATWALFLITKTIPNVKEPLERKTRLELATPTLARLCSTN